MNENEQAGAKIKVLVQDGKPIVVINGKQLKLKNGEALITMDDMVDASVVGFNRMHKKLEMLLESSPNPKKTKLENLKQLIANSPLIRLSHVEHTAKVPRYIARQIFDELVNSKACVMSGGAIKKTKTYYEVIRDFDVRLRERSRTDEFIIPAEFDNVPGAATPPLCEWELKNLYRLREDAIEHGVERSKMEPIHRQISLKEEEAKEQEKERLEEIMKEHNVGKFTAEEILDKERAGETYTQTKGDDDEWKGNEAIAESEEQEERQTKRKKKGAQTKRMKTKRK